MAQKITDTEIGRADLECEDAILSDKQRFGRVRTSLMRHLRAKYGEKTANKALSRINKRFSKGSLKIREHLKHFSIDN